MRRKKLITIKDLDKWGSCSRGDGERYSDDRLHKLLRGRKGWTPADVSRMRSVPSEDRIWVLLRPEVLGRDGLLRVVDAIADRAVRRHALHCGVGSVEAWARRWLSGEDRTEAAAWAVADASPADASARAAARVAALAARAAGLAAAPARVAWLAAGAAADAAWARVAAAWAAEAVEDAERRWQLSLIRREVAA